MFAIRNVRLKARLYAIPDTILRCVHGCVAVHSAKTLYSKVECLTTRSQIPHDATLAHDPGDRWDAGEIAASGGQEIALVHIVQEVRDGVRQARLSI